VPQDMPPSWNDSPAPGNGQLRRQLRMGWLILVVSLAVHVIALWAMPAPLRAVLTPQQDILISLKEPPPPPPPPPLPEPEPPPPEPETATEIAQPERVVEHAAPEPGPIIGVEGEGAGAIQSGESLPAFPESEPEPVVEPPPPPPLPEVEPEPEVDIEAILRVWQAGIKAEIEAQKQYPAIAERLGHTGSVKFRFSLDAGGGLLSLSVKSSSGWEELDEAALDAVRAAAPFASIPQELGREELALSMTLRFKLD